MTSGSNNIHFVVVAGGNIPIIVVLFPGKRNWVGGSINLKNDPNTYGSLYIPSNEKEDHDILSD